MKLLSTFLLLGISLGSCQKETPDLSSDMQTEKHIVDQSLKIDPNQVIVASGESINEVNIPILRAAKLYEDYSGKRVIMTKEIAETELSFVMRGPLTNAEAARLFQQIVLSEGLAMIPIPDEADIVRLIPSGPITGGGTHGAR